MRSGIPTVSEPAVDIEGLSKSYGAIKALDGAALKVSPGQVFGLVGPNGSGKTTLIKALCGILKPDGGGVRCWGSGPTATVIPCANAWDTCHKPLRFTTT